MDRDGWTIRSADRTRGVHVEHGLPAITVMALSATQPSTSAAKSRLTTSPSRIRSSRGSPWSTASFTDRQMTFPNGRAPNDGW
jgi:hypothetical protein